MPLPGDIIDGMAESTDKKAFVAVKDKAELSWMLGKMSQRHVENVTVKVRRGESTLWLRARIAQDKCSLLHRRFTFKAATDGRQVVVVGDLSLEQCDVLQEMSRRVVNSKCSEFTKRGVQYDWKLKVEGYLPDQRCTVVGSVLFETLRGECSIQPIASRCMAWFTAAVSSGVPLVFVNIQTEQLASSPTNGPLAQGIRLWFLPGIREVFLELIPEESEDRFGLDIKRTEEGFICVCSVTKGSASDRAGLLGSCGQLLAVSRVEGKNAMPSSVCAAGLINCCDHNEIRDTLVSAIHHMQRVGLHVMAWPDQAQQHQHPGLAALRPPSANSDQENLGSYSFVQTHT